MDVRYRGASNSRHESLLVRLVTFIVIFEEDSDPVTYDSDHMWHNVQIAAQPPLLFFSESMTIAKQLFDGILTDELLSNGHPSPTTSELAEV